MAAPLTGVYLHVVADVISSVRADFMSEGVEEAVLQELQSLWELNMMQTGVIQATTPELSYTRGVGGGNPAITPVHDLNMPYEGETPTAELLFPPTPVYTPLSTFNAPGRSPSVSEHREAGIIGDIAIGRPAPFMSPAWISPQLGTTIGMNPRLDMNKAYDGVEEDEPPSGQYTVTKEFLPPFVGKRKREDTSTSYLSRNYLAQHDGAGDILVRPFGLSQTPCGLHADESFHIQDSRNMTTQNVLRKGLPQRERSEEANIPQSDGIADNHDDVRG